MNIKENYEKALTDLWEKTKKIDSLDELSKSIISRGFAIEKNLPENGVLFIGMNPSFKTGCKDLTKNDKDGNIFYELGIKTPHSYFNKFLEIVNELDFEQFSHHDMFFVRETSQKTLEALRSQTQLTDFFDKQLKISTEIIKNVKPKLIVVCNAGARELFFNSRLFSVSEDSFDERCGAYKLTGLNDIPIIFTGMLSGQHALDNGSFTTLKWHIKYVLQYMESMTHL